MSVPQQIGRYPVEEELGKGGMGVVYRARDPKLDRLVAIKVLSDGLAKKPEELSRFEREARILARFNHPHIATIYGLEETEDGRKFLVLEYIEGQSLAERLKSGPLGVDASLRVARQIASALVAAHRRDVIHRDLKPANVLIDAEGSAKVLDFGLAKAAAEIAIDADAPTREIEIEIDAAATDMFHTRAGLAMGTPSYMSPEQVRGQALDHRADLFALGCVLFECLTGRKVFPGSTLADVFAATLHAEPDWSAVPADTPDGIRDLLARALEKDSTRRLADASSALEEIEAARGTPSSVRAVPAGAREIANNLPRTLSSFVGRRREVEQAQALLASSRLLTLTGSGGCGKTRLGVRLAEEVIAEYPDGCWFADLAATADAGQVESVVLAALGLHEEAHRSALETVVDFLKDRTSLILLDNCEHVLGPSSRLAEGILSRASNVRILATSREALGVAGETIYVVPSLSISETSDETTAAALESYESVALFVERARAAKPGFRLDDASAPHVARICRRLDGIPLAIELAAARTRALSPEKIAQRLARNFSILTGGSRTALPRQQTLRAAFDWSYNMLGPEEQLLLRRLSVFAGGFTLEAAERVGSDEEGCDTEPRLDEGEVLDVLTSLVEKSLIVYEDAGDDDGRYRLLESGRQFAREMLAQSACGDAVRTRHLDFFVALAEHAESELVGHEQPAWLHRLSRERDNIEAALEWCGFDAEGGEKAVRLAGAMWRSWSMQGRWATGLAALSRALELGRAPSEARVKALNGAGILTRNQGGVSEARRLHEEALALARELRYEAGAAQALYSLGMLRLWGDSRAADEGDDRVPAAKRALEECLRTYRKLGDDRGIASALQTLGWIAQNERDVDRARDLYEETLSIRQALGDQHGMGTSYCTLGFVAIQSGDLARAEERFEDGLAIFRRLRSTSGIGWALANLGSVKIARGDDKAACALLEESLTLRREIKDSHGIAWVLADLSIARSRDGDLTAAAANARESVLVADSLGVHGVDAGSLAAAADVILAGGDAELAVRLHAYAQNAGSASDHPLLEINRKRHLGSIKVLRTRLVPAAFAKAWEGGKALSREDAFREAVDAIDRISPPPDRGSSGSGSRAGE